MESKPVKEGDEIIIHWTNSDGRYKVKRCHDTHFEVECSFNLFLTYAGYCFYDDGITEGNYKWEKVNKKCDRCKSDASGNSDEYLKFDKNRNEHELFKVYLCDDCIKELNTHKEIK